jgi:hypothetical protein
MTNCVCHDVPLEDCPTIRKSPALLKMVRQAGPGDNPCVGSPFVNDCPERGEYYVLNLDGEPVYFCAEHFAEAVSWLTKGEHASEEAARLAEELLRHNAKLGNPIRKN